MKSKLALDYWLAFGYGVLFGFSVFNIINMLVTGAGS